MKETLADFLLIITVVLIALVAAIDLLYPPELPLLIDAATPASLPAGAAEPRLPAPVPTELCPALPPLNPERITQT